MTGYERYQVSLFKIRSWFPTIRPFLANPQESLLMERPLIKWARGNAKHLNGGLHSGAPKQRYSTQFHASMEETDLRMTTWALYRNDEREEILCRNNKTNPSERPSSALSLHSVWVFRYVFFLQPSTKRALSNYLHILFHSLLPLKEVFLRWPLKAIQARRPKTHQKTSFADALCASWLLPGVDPKTSLAKERTLEENTHEERDRN